ncbi:MAG: hypothetical protein Kow0042_15550 [Calditrichia bacterium]
MVLFGIFFPAVTGFTAGVQMSGDLRDPNRSIPIGTMAAIGVGFVVYVGLAVFSAFSINREMLIQDTNVLIKVARISPLVVAGIWGATLSSAMGSILGAPRILQAMSRDGITPRIFARGHGKSNEPRHALIFTFFLAAGIIWIGELNLIARIVSIFFITTYGVLNLSFSLENWASTDFRPSFRIPTWVGVLGTATAFLVMIELDVVALIAATLILGGIFIVLKRRQLVLESGDAWQGVWSSLVQAGLSKLTSNIITERNWRPNIILFSGGTAARPYLVEMARWIAYKRGMVSNFDLIANPKSQVLFNRAELPSVDKSLGFPGFFSRRIECRDIYEGMDQITRVYGFSGIEPNTVQLGWARNTANPDRFMELLYQMQKQDYNILLLKYHKERGFGDRQTIDIWWRGGSSNAALALNLLKFIQSNEEWQEATARILIVIQESALANKVFRNMNHILTERRLNAQVKVINNAVEKRSFSEILTAESAESDLVILGLPQFSSGTNGQFIAQMNQLIEPLGSVLLISAASNFKPYFIGIERKEPAATGQKIARIQTELPPLSLPSHGALANYFSDYYQWIESSLNEFLTGYIEDIRKEDEQLLEAIENLIRGRFELLEKRADEPLPRFRKLAAQQQRELFFQAQKILSNYKDQQTPKQAEELNQGLDSLLQRWQEILKAFPEKIVITPEDDTESTDQNQKRGQASPISHSPKKKQKIPLRYLFTYLMKQMALNSLRAHLSLMGTRSYDTITDLQKLFKRVLDRFTAIVNSDNPETENLGNARRNLLEELQQIRENNELFWLHFTLPLLKNWRISLNQLVEETTHFHSKRYFKKKYPISKSSLNLEVLIREIPSQWSRNKQLLTEFAVMELHLIHFQSRLKTVLQKVQQDLQLALKNNLADPLGKMEHLLLHWKKDSEMEKFHLTLPAHPEEFLDAEALIERLDEDIHPALNELPEIVDILAEDSFQNLNEKQYEGVEVVSLLLRRMVSRSVAIQLLDPLKEEIIRLTEECKQAVESLNDVARLIRFQLAVRQQVSETVPEEEEKSREDFVPASLERLQEVKLSLQNLQEQITHFLEKQLKSLADKLNPYQISISTRMEGLRIQREEGKRVLRYLQKVRQDIHQRYDQFLERLVFSSADRLKWERTIRRPFPQIEKAGNPLQQFMEEILPSPPNASHLPFFYRQLFLGKQPVGAEFWIPRPVQEKQAQQSIERFQQGMGGALLILGEPLSGKTWLSLRIAQKHFLRPKIYSLHPPQGGSSDAQQFRRQLAVALGVEDEFAALLDTLDSENALILHDLEMWWLRHPDGSPAMEEILQLLRKFSQRIFMIVTIDRESYQAIAKIYPLAEWFSHTIVCTPFSAREIAHAIFLRHNSAGLPVLVNGTRLLELSAYRRARIFNAFYHYSAGNIGSVFHAWIRHIQKESSGGLKLHIPQPVDLNLFQLPDDSYWMIVFQILLHKQLSRERLSKVTEFGDEDLSWRLDFLSRFQVISEIGREVWQINPYLLPFLYRKLKMMGWL